MKARNFRRATERQLLAYAKVALCLMIADLEQVHMDPKTKQVEPRAIRQEVQELRNWVARARALTDRAAPNVNEHLGE